MTYIFENFPGVGKCGSGEPGGFTNYTKWHQMIVLVVRKGKVRNEHFFTTVFGQLGRSRSRGLRILGTSSRSRLSQAFHRAYKSTWDH